MNNNQKFWRYFWGTIIVLFIAYISALLYLSFEQNKQHLPLVVEKQSNLVQNGDGSITIAPDFFKTLDEQLPFISHDINGELNKTQSQIYSDIDKEVDALFAPVYKQIPKYADFHYSVTGEYSEIGSALSGNLANSIKEKLFDVVHFDENYKNALGTVEVNSQSFISESLKNINENSQERLGLGDAEMKIFNKASDLAIDDSMNRFNDITHSIMRAGALGTGAKFSTVFIAKVMGKKIATKVLAKAAVKTGAKASGIGGGAAVGATVGSVVPIIGTGAGAIVGAVIGWFAVDKVIIEMDEVLNRDEFEKDLRVLITKQKEEMKREMKGGYFQSLKSFADELKESYKKLKLKDIITKGSE